MKIKKQDMVFDTFGNLYKVLDVNRHTLLVDNNVNVFKISKKEIIEVF